MTPKLENLASCAVALMALQKEYPSQAELGIGLGLVMEELKREIKSMERKRAA